jgi:hypothetical protein
MEIKITTATKKLTASLVNQMPGMTNSMTAMLCCTTLGYVMHASVNKKIKTAIIKYGDEYYVMPLRKWHIVGYSLQLVDDSSIFRRETVVRPGFKSLQHRNAWLEEFENMKTQALNKHIYL